MSFLVLTVYLQHILILALCYTDNNGYSSLSEKALFAHNTVRYNHAVENLIWDNQLWGDSQRYAEVLADSNSLHHSEESKLGIFGENLYKGFDGFKGEKTVADAVYNWYLEIQGYDFNNPAPDLEKHGHFTAVTWRSTSRVGCGIASRDMYGGKMTFIVCRYVAQGNIDGLFLFNVMQLRFGAVIPTSPKQLELPLGCVDQYKRCSVWTQICDQQVFRTLMLAYCKKTCNIC